MCVYLRVLDSILLFDMNAYPFHSLLCKLREMRIGWPSASLPIMKVSQKKHVQSRSGFNFFLHGITIISTNHIDSRRERKCLETAHIFMQEAIVLGKET